MPCKWNGHIPGYNPSKLVLLKKYFPDCKIIPWIGGSVDSTVSLDDPVWIKNFVLSVQDLLKSDKIDGVHINIEPLHSGDKNFLFLLEEIRKIKGNKLLSVAAYPPPTIFHPYPEVHWDLSYSMEVLKICDQYVPMMYDTSIRHQKVFTNLIAQWTSELIDIYPNKQILLGVPAYEDEGVGYHNPKVENVHNSLPGIVRGLNNRVDAKGYGFALYADWTLDDNEIKYVEKIIP